MRSTAALVCTSVLLSAVFAPSISARPARNVDPCLVGNWVLKRMSSTIPGLRAGGVAGAKMTIRRSGYTTVVLTGSAPYVGIPMLGSEQITGVETFYVNASRKNPQRGDKLLPDRFHTDYGYSDILSPVHSSVYVTTTLPDRTYTKKRKFFDTFSYTCTASTLTMDIGYNSPASGTAATDNIAVWTR